MNVGIFGGTFDPVHRGHLAVARAAQQAFRLARIYFVPADLPPHKRRVPITPYAHRYAMLALALRDEPKFVPSTMEARDGAARPNYTLDTVRRFRATLPTRDRLFFIIGIDAFLDFDTWHKPREVMKEVEFIVVSRPGYDDRRPAIMGSRVHWLGSVAEDVSSTSLRSALAKGKVSKRFLDEAVVDYIRKEHLYGARDKGRGTRAKRSS
ncbi:MAG: nicotinate-nucleotide adenylyltransferase [Terriglobales bacterium]